LFSTSIDKCTACTARSFQVRALTQDTPAARPR
jgi:hypothetical protein